MASNYYVITTVDGKKQRYKREVKQGRNPSGLGKTKAVRLYKSDEEKMKILKEKYGCYWNENEFIRSAVSEKLNNSVYTELLIPELAG